MGVVINFLRPVCRCSSTVAPLLLDLCSSVHESPNYMHITQHLVPLLCNQLVLLSAEDLWTAPQTPAPTCNFLRHLGHRHWENRRGLMWGMQRLRCTAGEHRCSCCCIRHIWLTALVLPSVIRKKTQSIFFPSGLFQEKIVTIDICRLKKFKMRWRRNAGVIQMVEETNLAVKNRNSFYGYFTFL